MAQLLEAIYWVGKGKNASSHCVTCQLAKATATHPAPLQPVLASRPWEVVEINILKIPMSLEKPVYACGVRVLFEVAVCCTLV